MKLSGSPSKSRERLDDHRPHRKDVPRFRRRLRRVYARPSSSARRRGGEGTTRPHGAVGEDDVQRADGPAREAPRRDHARRPGDLVLREQRHRGGRRCDQARARGDEAPRDRRDDAAFHGKTFGALSASGREAFRDPSCRCSPTCAACRSATRRRCAAPSRRVRRSSSSRCRAKAASTCRPTAICARCARRATPGRSVDRRRGADRTGPLRRRCSRATAKGVVPDVMTLAKGLSGGVVPIGAYVARPRYGTPRTAKRRCCTRRRSAAANSRARRRSRRSTCCSTRTSRRTRACAASS